MVELDEQITLWLNGFYSEPLDTFFWYVSWKYTWFMIGAVMAALLFWKKKPKEAVIFLLFVAVMILFADQICNLFKHTVQIILPERSVPMLRIIAGTELQRVPGKILFFSHGLMLLFLSNLYAEFRLFR